MDKKGNPFICSQCGENKILNGAVCPICQALLCPHCDCAYTINGYCYCDECGQMVANSNATAPALRGVLGCERDV